MLNMFLHTHTYQVLSVTELMDKDGLDIKHLVGVGDELCEIDGICSTCSRLSMAYTCMYVRVQGVRRRNKEMWRGLAEDHSCVQLLPQTDGHFYGVEYFSLSPMSECLCISLSL